MKAYGVQVTEWPDVADIQHEGRKSSVGKVRSKKGYIRSSSRKRAIRRYWKRQARRIGDTQCGS